MGGVQLLSRRSLYIREGATSRIASLVYRLFYKASGLGVVYLIQVARESKHLGHSTRGYSSAAGLLGGRQVRNVRLFHVLLLFPRRLHDLWSACHVFVFFCSGKVILYLLLCVPPGKGVAPCVGYFFCWYGSLSYGWGIFYAGLSATPIGAVSCGDPTRTGGEHRFHGLTVSN